MARDVEFSVTASDRTGVALASVERKFKDSNRRVENEHKKHTAKLAKVLESDLVKGVQSVGKDIGALFENAGQLVVPVLGSAIAAAAPLIGATLGAAISAGAAVGAVGIGVALVAQDARVKAAGTRLGKSLFSSLQQDAAPFIGPVLAAIDTIQAKFNDLNPTIRHIFANASKFVAPLVGGVTHAIDAVVSGVDKLVAKSGGVVDALSASIGQIGDSLGNFLANIDTKDAQAALVGLTNTITGLIDVLGPVINGLSKVYGIFDKFAPSILSVIGKFKQTNTIAGRVAGSTDAVATSFTAASGAAAGLTGNLDGAVQSLEEQRVAADSVSSANRSLYSSATAVGQAFDDAKKAAKDNGKTLSEVTVKGRANREVLAGLASTLGDNYTAFVKVNGEGAAASTLGGKLRASFVKAAQGFGLSEKAAIALADKILGIPNSKTTKAYVNTHDAEARIRALQAKIDALRGKTVTITTHFKGDGSNQNSPSIGGGGGRTFDANDSYRGGSAGLSRTGGPSRVEDVNVRSSVAVNLDGQPFRNMVASAVSSSERRAAFRQRVGSR